MKSLRIALLGLVAVAAHSAHAQWAVFDGSNYANGLNEFHQLQQAYTTANQTRDQIITTYNLAYQMSRMPQNLYQRYSSSFSQWTNTSAANTYGNTSNWTDAVNLGGVNRANAAVSSALTPLQPYPAGSLSARDASTQATIKSQYASSQLSQGAMTNTLSTIGTIRSNSEAFNQKLSQLESDTYSTDPNQQTQMAVLGKIDTAAVLQIRSQQDTNQLLAAIAAQQAAEDKAKLDAQNRALNQAIYFEQNFSPAMQKMTGGSSDALHQMNLSIPR